MKLVPVLFPVCVLLLLSSCKKREDTTCDEPLLAVRGLGYVAGDLDGASMHTYRKNSSHTDSNLLYTWYPSTFSVFISGDTISFDIVNSECDYEIRIPKTGQVLSISNITRLGLKQKTFTYSTVPGTKWKQRYCYNNVVSCDVNLVSTAVNKSAGPDPDTLYLHL